MNIVKAINIFYKLAALPKAIDCPFPGCKEKFVESAFFDKQAGIMDKIKGLFSDDPLSDKNLFEKLKGNPDDYADQLFIVLLQKAKKLAYYKGMVPEDDDYHDFITETLTHEVREQNADLSRPQGQSEKDKVFNAKVIRRLVDKTIDFAQKR